ncbi:MAG: acetyl-CoA carboxylase, carboxyltransferase subunit beta [Armatimonadota bacterium]|nr:acetyl-CoA carboxylase, carboxyltransferase subunit beta [Armatimonadota bacterium]
MARDDWFGLKSGKARKLARKSADAVPDGLWIKCPKCGEILFNKELEKNLRVCNKCGYHYKLGAMQRIAMTVDEDTFEEIATGLRPGNPLDFPDYEDKLEKDRKTTGLEEAIVVGTAAIGGRRVVIGAADFTFRGGSMGSVYGEKIVQAVEKALDERLPVVLFCCSGGARMQEGILSLMQMAKTSAAIARMSAEKLPYISVLVDPCTAGVHASFASLGDVMIAEPGALIGFAGARVAQQAGVINRPPNFQQAEFQLDNGMVDMVTPRKELRQTLIKILQFCCEDIGNAA